MSELYSRLVYVTIEVTKDPKEKPSYWLQTGAYGFTREYVLTPITDIFTKYIPKSVETNRVPKDVRIFVTDTHAVFEEINYVSYFGNHSQLVLKVSNSA